MNQYEKTQLLEDHKDEILFTLDNLLMTKTEVAEHYGVHRTTLYRALKRWENDYYIPYKRKGELPYLFNGGDMDDYWRGYLTQRGSMRFWEREGKYVKRIVTPRLTVSGPKAREFADFAGVNSEPPVQVTLNQDEANALTYLSVSEKGGYTYSKTIHFLRGIYEATEEEGSITFLKAYWYYDKTKEYLDELGVEWWVDEESWKPRIILDSVDFLN